MVTQHLLKNKNIKTKIVFMYLPLVLLPLMLLGYVAVNLYTETITVKTQKSMQDHSKLVSTRIQGIMDNVQNSANMLTLNLNQIITSYGKGSSVNDSIMDLRLYTTITNELNFSQLVFPEVASLAFVSETGRIYGSNPRLENHRINLIDTPIIENLKDTSGSNIWFVMERRDYLVDNPNEVVFTLGKKVYDIKTGNSLGYLILNVNEATLSNVYNQIGFIPNEEYLLINEQGIVVSAANSDQLLTPMQEADVKSWVLSGSNKVDILATQQGVKLISSFKLPQHHWYIIHMIPFNELTKEINQMRNIIIISGLIMLVIAMLASNILSNVIAKPIVSLSRSMKRFREGHLDMELKVKSRDEIGLLAIGFNTMIGRMKQLLNRIKTEQEKKREIELALIQSQIKPHFLYNTLDVIYTLSEMNRPKDVQKTTKSLADFYRSVLSKGRELITVEEELDNVRDYLFIQQIRYADVFDYSINLNRSIYSVLIPKLSIQPLVENAIYHGLKEKDSFGRLTIKGYKEANQCLLEIVDDGVGIPPERLSVIQSEINGERSDTIYGLHNVHRRLRLIFGAAYGIEIESGLGEGTTTRIRLPLTPSQL